MLRKFNSIDDARIFYQDSGVFNWQWYDGFSEDAFVEYLYRNADDGLYFEDVISMFLVQNGQNPREYGIW